jgi:aryl-alcohol dehydrogenase-like predicted oxidoreductase
MTSSGNARPVKNCWRSAIVVPQEWAADIGAATWAQFILKFILAQPAVTVAIPATTRVDHVRENMAAASDPIPDDALRERMAAYVRDV